MNDSNGKDAGRSSLWKHRSTILIALIAVVLPGAYIGYRVYEATDAGLWADLRWFQSCLDGTRQNCESIWHDNGNAFYTRSVQRFSLGPGLEAICKVKDADAFPSNTKRGVVVTSRHLEGNYWLLELKD